MKKYKIERKPLNEARRKYIEKIIERLEKQDFESSVVNLMQSFIYLILNKDFYCEIIKIRERLDINEYEFNSKDGYKKWKNNERLKSLYNKVETLVDGHKLCHLKHRLLIIELIKNYVLLKTDSFVSLNEDSWEFNKFVGGFDVPDPKCGKYNTKNFDKIWWELYIQPMNNVVQFKRDLKHYFYWMMKFHFKEFLNSDLFRHYNKDILKTTNLRIKKPAELKIVFGRDKATLKFISYHNTKTKEIVRLFEKNQSEIVKFQKNSKSLQKDIRGQLKVLPIKLKHYFHYLEGKSAPEIERLLYNKCPTSIYSRQAELIRTHIKETKRRASLGFKRKLSL